MEILEESFLDTFQELFKISVINVEDTYTCICTYV